MTLLETLAAISFVGFLAAAVFSLKRYFATREATNAWLLFAIGFALLAVRHFFVLYVYLDGSLGYLDELARDFELVGIAIIFSSLAVYYKEKRVCDYCCKKKGDGKTLKHAKRFADGV